MGKILWSSYLGNGCYGDEKKNLFRALYRLILLIDLGIAFRENDDTVTV